MTWLQGDVWQAEVLLPAGQRIEYKYVILEEQVLAGVGPFVCLENGLWVAAKLESRAGGRH
jgi:hypothetical protein